jgi:hypothetical protein
MARPSDYSPGIIDEICERISEGASLRSVCKSDDVPSVRTILNWLSKHPEAQVQYALACDARQQHLFDELREISDDSSKDWINKPDGKGGTIKTFDGEHVQRARLRVDTLKWMLSKLDPKKFGDKIETNAVIDTTSRIEVGWGGEAPRYQRAKALAALVAEFGYQLVPGDAVLLSGPRAMPASEYNALTRKLADEGFLEEPSFDMRGEA